MFPKKELAQLVISACHQFHIDTVVISPGSRNAPLTVGFSNHSEIETLSIVDERCAAFFALGIAQQKQKPVAVKPHKEILSALVNLGFRSQEIEEVVYALPGDVDFEQGVRESLKVLSK